MLLVVLNKNSNSTHFSTHIPMRSHAATCHWQRPLPHSLSPIHKRIDHRQTSREAAKFKRAAHTYTKYHFARTVNDIPNDDSNFASRPIQATTLPSISCAIFTFWFACFRTLKSRSGCDIEVIYENAFSIQFTIFYGFFRKINFSFTFSIFLIQRS